MSTRSPAPTPPTPTVTDARWHVASGDSARWRVSTDSLWHVAIDSPSECEPLLLTEVAMPLLWQGSD